ncbi:uncharacterized protein YjbK [Melghiribacillus thermohalophilus]|uniref:Uncharacterized protein YjbK n=1 Tax=Melghiribacillus thermohalophilus TaxID=1324956 RepID=A0A4R3N5P4_9BACI|nr:CYTH domain-containing protein [Melghiribacillus thermohalophilus]TCT22403.1 uncharacterized protein YjbK [Melghiribacillus thermohalophilus]
MQEVEIEFKNMLTKDEYHSLIKKLHLSESQSNVQTNYYFETENFQLKQHNAALRIREKDGKYQCTLKQPRAYGLLETHDWLTKEECSEWISGNVTLKENVGKRLKEMGISSRQLVYQGKLITRRIETPWRDCTLVLDHSQYKGTEDFELELEATEYKKGRAVFLALLTNMQIPARNTPNKIERFFKSK